MVKWRRTAYAQHALAVHRTWRRWLLGAQMFAPGLSLRKGCRPQKGFRVIRHLCWLGLGG